MSCKVMYTCDHCNTHCSGEQYASIGRWDESGIIALGKTVHGCSKEHLGIALAKMFGIGINGETDELLNRKQRELTKLADANSFLVTEHDNMRARIAELEARMPANEVTNVERAQYDRTIELQRKRIEELEKRIAELTTPINADNTSPSLDDLAKKLVPVFEQAFKDGPNNRLQSVRAGLRAALAALPMPIAQSVTVDGKTPGQKDAAQMVFPDEPQKRFRYERVWLSEQTDDALFDLYMDHVGFFDMNGTMIERENMIETLAAIEQEQAITLPTKPTKPLRERLEDLASYWEKGAASSSMSEGYRQASKDCAKELREVIDDPR